MSPVADDAAARALWAANQARLYASLKNLQAGVPRPAWRSAIRTALRFAVPVLLALAFAVAWGEWATRLGEAFSPVAVAPPAVAARIDAWVDPPAYTRQAPVFLSRRTGDAGEPSRSACRREASSPSASSRASRPRSRIETRGARARSRPARRAAPAESDDVDPQL